MRAKLVTACGCSMELGISEDALSTGLVMLPLAERDPGRAFARWAAQPDHRGPEFRVRRFRRTGGMDQGAHVFVEELTSRDALEAHVAALRGQLLDVRYQLQRTQRQLDQVLEEGLTGAGGPARG